jgi:serine/threonine protein kinase
MTLTGQKLGHFQVLELLGRGGMGEVYKGFDEKLKRHVALKVIAGAVTRDDDRRARLMREARAASSLNHPNIVTIYEVGAFDRHDFIAMEYIEGRPLHDLIEGVGLDLGQAVDYAIQIADALARAHEHGIIHRDLKPRNVLITRNDAVKVLDFGLAKVVDDHGAEGATTKIHFETTPGAVLGTASYMSPEQAEGKPLDTRSDIFSFGILLYEMIAGQRPFSGRSTAALLGAILRDQPRPLSEGRRGVPPELARIVAKALEKGRDYRYQHVQDLLADLRKLKRDLGPLEPRSAHTRRGWRALYWLAAAGLLVAALTLWMFRLRNFDAPKAELRLVSTFPGSHRAPSFSADGNLVAFESDVGGVSQIWIKNLTQGEPLQLTDADAPSYRPRWSPANDQIVFYRPDGIWSVPVPKGAPRRIMEGGSNPNWSWDGRRLVYERNEEIWVADADGANPRKVDGVPVVPNFVLGRRPAFSPDGATIAYFQSRSNSPLGDVWGVSLTGGSARPLTKDGAIGGTPTWTPDGRSIIYSSSRAGSMTLWKVPASGGTPSPITLGAGEDTEPEISRDGRKLIYTNTRSTFVLKLLDATTAQQRDLFEVRDRKIVFPSFSPGGERIAFFRLLDEGDSHLFVIDRDGRNLAQVTRTRGEQNIFPRWSPEGAALYYFGVRPRAAFRKIGVDGGRPLEVVPEWAFGVVRWPDLDPTGKYVVYVRNERGKGDATFLRDLGTGTETPLPVLLDMPRWSKDGRFIAGNRGGQIRIYSVAERSERVVTKGKIAQWNRDDSVLYFQRSGRLTDGAEIWRIGRDGTGENKVAELWPMVSIDPFYDVSPRDEIVWVQFKPGAKELWMMDLPK